MHVDQEQGPDGAVPPRTGWPTGWPSRTWPRPTPTPSTTATGSRWEALFTPDGLVDYTRAGGIAGTPAEVAAWMPGAMAVFTFCLHTTSTHQVRFTGPDSADGTGPRVQPQRRRVGGPRRTVRRGRRLRRRLRAHR